MKMKVGFNRFVEHNNRYFQELIEIVLVFAMLVFGVSTLLPVELLPGNNSVYHSNFAKIPFGLLLILPGISLLYLRIKHSIQDYVYVYKEARRQSLFYMLLGWLYLTVLRLSIAIYPPFYVLYFALGVITYFCYLRLSK
jgi:hypothetical protein